MTDSGRDPNFLYSGPEMRVLARVAVLIYAAVLLVAPVAHDVADHGRSPAHCQLCTAKAQAARVEPSAATSVPPPVAAGEVHGRPGSGFVTPVPCRTSGRSPPA